MKRSLLAAFLALYIPNTFAQTTQEHPTEFREATAEERTGILSILGEEKVNTIANEALKNYSLSLNQLLLEPVTATPSKVMVPMAFDLNQTESNGKPLFHQIYIAWGYNRAYHSNTDVKFTTPDGTFVVHNTVGKDRPSPFDPNVYFNPTKFTIPQYNLEIGIMFNSKWGIELKADHMKWVFDSKRPYEITGNYNHDVVVSNPTPVADWDMVKAVPFSVAAANKDATWLAFEHSDGYNYESIGVIRNVNLYKTKNQKLALDARLGAGAGFIMPKTKVMMHQDYPWNWEGLDNKFHIAGGGVHAEAKLMVTFFSRFYVQASTRGTYIKVKDALVDGTESRLEHIQPITSIQFMGHLGYIHPLHKKKKRH